jgi:ribosomal protein S18 acetylase RimI-like enzyme
MVRVKEEQEREDCMEVRLATAAEEAEVCRLWTMLLEFYQKSAAPDVLHRSFRYAVNHPQKVLIFIILIEGVVTGTASLHLGHYSTWNDNWYGHIEDVIIDPAYRGRGLASHLLSHVIVAAREQNLSRIEVNALKENHSARKMYEKLGFTTDSVAYELPLS